MKWMKGSFSRNALWSLLGGGVPALAGLLAIPLLVHLLNVEQFALVSLLLSFNLFFFVYDVGLTRTMHFLAPKKVYLSLEGAGRLVTSCLFVGLLIGLVLTLFFSWISPLIVLNWLNVDVSMRQEAILAFQLTAISITPALLINVLKGNLEGRQLFRSANICKIISGVSLFIFPVFAAFYSDKLFVIALAIVISRILSFLVYVKFTFSKFSLKHIRMHWEDGRKIIRYTFWAGISGFFATLFIYGDRFIVAGYIDTTSLAIYITSQDVLIRYLLIPWSIAIVLAPFFASENLDVNAFSRAYSTAIKQISILTLAFVCATIILLFIAVPLWLNADLVNITRQLSGILMIGVVFAAFSQLPLIYLYAKGQAKLLSTIFIGEGLLYLLIAPFIFDEFGVIGAACVWSVRLFLELILLSYFSHRLLRL
ncbi:MAG: oligosaccharide flippase family protein [Methylomonas sp.]|jgi:O-antigen/teichoic acid export membrane protein|uniref:oligosaccharide flippase family protein n=1 Tax=Methylomonas sp. TaxID=418 RepID=UPI0025F990DC|nr:oligosaccharide flippase family protein [Methylomonas sp.]MCK9607879.1 oligosaccharide flippase family protein [Methylomonas sp.]